MPGLNLDKDRKSMAQLADAQMKMLQALQRHQESNSAWSLSALAALKEINLNPDAEVHRIIVQEKMLHSDEEVKQHFIQKGHGENCPCMRCYRSRGGVGTVTRMRECMHCHEITPVYSEAGGTHACKECVQHFEDRGDLVAEQIVTIKEVTEFDAFMACPYCGVENWHWLRVARHKPHAPELEMNHPLRIFFRNQKTFLNENAYHYGQHLGSAGGDHIMEFGSTIPVRIIGGDERVLRLAHRIQPIRVDAGPSSGYDPDKAKCIRTCTDCSKEWAQK
jgi:hypothetical protein